MTLSASAVLSVFAGLPLATYSTARTPLLFRGTLLDDTAKPVLNAHVQFWQTDSHGLYNHPQSVSERGELNPSFQYFGTDQTDENGEFSFTTYKPGLYPSRPIAHIHFKVFVGGVDILTSQFYFAGENGGNPSMLTLDLEETTDLNGATSWVANKTVVVNLGGGGTTSLTPSDAEGPYYPTIDFFGFDNDLTRTSNGADQTNPPLPVDTTPQEAMPTASPEVVTELDSKTTLEPTTSPASTSNPISVDEQQSSSQPAGPSEMGTKSGAFCSAGTFLASLSFGFYMSLFAMI